MDYLAKREDQRRSSRDGFEGLFRARQQKLCKDYIGAEFAGNMENSKNIPRACKHLEDLQDAMDAPWEKVTLKNLKKGLLAQIDFSRIKSGKKLKETNRLIGEWKAS